jgi:hypothetical protein
LGRSAARQSGEVLENEDEDIEIGGELVGVDKHNEEGDVLAGVGLLEWQLFEGRLEGVGFGKVGRQKREGVAVRGRLMVATWRDGSLRRRKMSERMSVDD